MMKPFLWRMGGPQGGGIDSAALLYARVCARHGLQVLARREYHSNISGRHSYSDVRIGEQAVHSHSASPQLLLCLDAETLCRHIYNVPAQGCIIYDKRDADGPLTQQKMLESLIIEQLSESLRRANLPATIAGLLAYATSLGIAHVPFDYELLFTALREELGVSKTTAERCRNVIAVAISAAMLNLDLEILCHEIEQVFQTKPAAIAINVRAATLAYVHAKSIAITIEHSLVGNDSLTNQRIWINGTQGVALGKLAAGLGLQSYYPISPASDESMYLESHIAVALHDGAMAGFVVHQTEDELAAISMACGAALAGARAATSTSGPGFSLMVEGLGWAGMNEVPVVVSLYQRGGPSTGMPTRTEQGDLQFVIYAGHGEFPRIVLASGDVEDCFYDAFRAFNYAERYQLPVIHLLDKCLAATSQTIQPFNTEGLTIQRGDMSPPSQSMQRVMRFAFTANGISPRPVLGQDKQIFWSTGVEHDENGQVSENPVMRQKMLEKRSAKLDLALAEIPLEEKLTVLGNAQADFTLVSWGSNKGVIIEAVERLDDEGISIRAILVKLLWPFPANEITGLLSDASTLIVLECNQTGQFSHLLHEKTGRMADHLILKYTGRPVVIEDLLRSLQQIAGGTAEKILVHQNPYE
jgi:2-oxoglutarate ferredoxin oxidoreductase subunit alpha